MIAVIVSFTRKQSAEDTISMQEIVGIFANEKDAHEATNKYETQIYKTYDNKKYGYNHQFVFVEGDNIKLKEIEKIPQEDKFIVEFEDGTSVTAMSSYIWHQSTTCYDDLQYKTIDLKLGMQVDNRRNWKEKQTVKSITRHVEYWTKIGVCVKT